jgi:hypothetical protein
MEISDRLGKFARYYHREAGRCARARAYLGASIMQVAALEASLQAMCFLYPEQLKKSTVYQRKRFRRKRHRALELSLYELIDIAEALSWFPPKRVSWGGKRASVAGFAHEIRKLRNFLHPGVWAREHPDMRFSKAAYDVVHEVFDVATSWLLYRVHESLRKRMKREGLR